MAHLYRSLKVRNSAFTVVTVGQIFVRLFRFRQDAKESTCSSHLEQRHEEEEDEHQHAGRNCASLQECKGELSPRSLPARYRDWEGEGEGEGLLLRLLLRILREGEGEGDDCIAAGLAAAGHP